MAEEEGQGADSSEAIPPEFAPLRAEWLQLLMQLGYVACGQGKPNQARTIFEGIAAVRPNSELPLIGLSMALINLGKLTEALELLVKRAAVLNPKNQMVHAMCAMIYRMSGAMEESDLLLDGVLADGTDPESCEFARQLKTENFAYLRSRGRR
jgi:predicted Zn-dependent protease